MARVHYIKKARVTKGKCGACGNSIKKGASYKWTQLYRASKQRRCSECDFKDSDLTGSDKLGRCYDARDGICDAAAGWEGKDIDDLKADVESGVEELREVASEYEQSADAIRDSFSESPTADECEERAQEIEGWADEIDGALDSVDTKDKDWQDDARAAVTDAASNCPV